MKSRYNYINPEQFRQILDYMDGMKFRKWDPNQIKMLFKIAYWIGLRMIEARHLKAEQFELEISKVYLGKTKSMDHDDRPIPEPFIDELAQFLKGKTGYLIKPIPHKNTILFWTDKIGNELEIEAWTTPQSISHEKTKGHAMRKSVGKDMMYGTPEITGGFKAPLSTIAKQLGHTNQMTTEKYLHVEGETVIDFWKQKKKSL